MLPAELLVGAPEIVYCCSMVTSEGKFVGNKKQHRTSVTKNDQDDFNRLIITSGYLSGKWLISGLLFGIRMLVNSPKSHNILARSFSITGNGSWENQVPDDKGRLSSLHKCQCTTRAIMLWCLVKARTEHPAKTLLLLLLPIIIEKHLHTVKGIYSK